MRRLMLSFLVIASCFLYIVSSHAEEPLLNYESELYSVALVDYRVYEGYGQDYLVLFADFTNNSSNAICYHMSMIDIDVYQNGEECGQGYITGPDDDTALDVKNGETVRVYENR